MEKFSNGVVKYRKAIVIACILLLIPCMLGFIKTRVNYDMLSYLPKDIESVKGQDILLEDFGKGSFAIVMFENMELKDVAKVKADMEKLEHVDTVLWYDSLADVSIPMDILPEEVYDAFNTEDGEYTMMAVFLDDAISSDASMETIEEMRDVAKGQCWISSMTAFIEDLKVLVEHEEPIYVAIAVTLALIIMMIMLDSFLIPFIFILCIGMAIIYNMGTNILRGEISFITMALAAVLQLAVTMDYSIFLWNAYKEHRLRGLDNKDAMAEAIRQTVSSISASSLTTIAGFIALCFMSYTLGLDLGIVMAKGVVLGVLSSVTLLPAMILVLDRFVMKTMHKPIQLSFADKLGDIIVKRRVICLIAFVVIAIPALYGYNNTQVYYNLDDTLPKELECVQASDKLHSVFNQASTDMILCDSEMEAKDAKEMMDRIKKVDGVKAVIGKNSFIGEMIPGDFVPDSLKDALEANGRQLMIVTSECEVASDEVKVQLQEIGSILHEYDKDGMLIGEAPCTEDLIKITDHDFKVVSAVSIGAILILILIAMGSLTLPLILVAVIEFAIAINLGIPFFTGTRLPFIANICISTIQLGATVDYAILMTNRYKKERLAGNDKSVAVPVALKTSLPSILVSALGFFFATCGVGVYSNIDLIGALCALMARGALISLLSVVFILPAMLYLFDGAICRTTWGMKAALKQNGN